MGGRGGDGRCWRSLWWGCGGRGGANREEGENSGHCDGYLLEDLVSSQVCIARLCDRGESIELDYEGSIGLRELCV